MKRFSEFIQIDESLASTILKGGFKLLQPEIKAAAKLPVVRQATKTVTRAADEVVDDIGTAISKGISRVKVAGKPPVKTKTFELPTTKPKTKPTLPLPNVQPSRPSIVPTRPVPKPTTVPVTRPVPKPQIEPAPKPSTPTKTDIATKIARAVAAATAIKLISGQDLAPGDKTKPKTKTDIKTSSPVPPPPVKTDTPPPIVPPIIPPVIPPTGKKDNISGGRGPVVDPLPAQGTILR